MKRSLMKYSSPSSSNSKASLNRACFILVCFFPVQGSYSPLPVLHLGDGPDEGKYIFLFLYMPFSVVIGFGLRQVLLLTISDDTE
jgi:hypothetical protein